MIKKKYKKGIVKPILRERNIEVDIDNTKREIQKRINFLKLQGITTTEILKEINSFLLA